MRRPEVVDPPVVRNIIDEYLKELPVTKLRSLQTMCRCVYAMYGQKDKRVKRTLEKICR